MLDKLRDCGLKLAASNTRRFTVQDLSIVHGPIERRLWRVLAAVGVCTFASVC